MLEERSTLAHLLNNDSFVRWLKRESSARERKWWEAWLEENDLHPVLKKRALKFISIPFKESQPENIDLEFDKLRKAVSTGTETETFSDD